MVHIIPSETRLYLGSIEIFRRRRHRCHHCCRTGSCPKNSDISTMVYGTTVRLAGKKALVLY